MAFEDKSPQINATGSYELRTPWVIDSNVDYRCEALRGFEELELDNIDVYDRFYNPKGVSEQRFGEDRVNGINIVTLMSTDGPTIHVPSSYILKFPNNLNVPHSRLIMAIDLGLIPDHLDFYQLQQDILALVTNTIGQQASMSIHRGLIEGGISKSRADAMVAQRKANSLAEGSFYAKYKKSEEERVKILDENQRLQTIITAINPPP